MAKNDKERDNLRVQTIIMKLSKLEIYVSIFFLVLILIIVSCEIVGRYLLNSPIYWSNEVAILFHAYVICFGFAAIYINKGDIYLLFLYQKVPKGKRIVIDLIAEVATLLFTITLLYLSIKYLLEYGNYTTGGLGIPSGFFCFPIVITSVSLVLATLLDLYKILKGRYYVDEEKEAHIIV